MTDIYSEKSKGFFTQPDAQVLKDLKEKKERCIYPSIFNFLKDQNGLRSGDTHTLLGMESSGKSSLVRTLILEAGYHVPILVYLSEETTEDIWYELNRSFSLLVQNGLADVMNDPKENINLIYEDDAKDSVSNYSDLLILIRHKLIESKAQAFFFDNITTSEFYDDLTPNEQKKFARSLKRMGKELDIPIFLVAHTQKEFNGKNIMRTGDVRGNNVIAMMSEHFYCFNARTVYNTATEKDERRVILQVTKMRGIDRDDVFYAMHYDFKTRLYDKDSGINSKIAREFLQASKPHAEDGADYSEIYKTREEKEREVDALCKKSQLDKKNTEKVVNGLI